MAAFQVKVLRTDDYMRVLETERVLTVAVNVGGHETHHQISIVEYDTREKIETRMAEIGAQVADELVSSKNSKRKAPIPADIQALIDENPL